MIGIHDGVAAEKYHADDVADEPTLNSSIAKILIEQTPRHAWASHPKLNPEFQPEDEPRFDLGSVAHQLILGRGGGFQIIHADDWRSKAAKEDRDAARAKGLTPILERQYDDAEAMSTAVCARLFAIHETRELSGADPLAGFQNGQAERVIIWRDIGGPLCRGMIDWHGPYESQVWDIKTTGLPLSEFTIARQIAQLSYDLQAAFYLRGLSALLPEWAGRFRWRWVFVQDSPPFEVRVFEPDAHMLAIGDRKAALAIAKWRRCLEADEWPGYPPIVTRLSHHPGVEERWIERELSDPDADQMAVSLAQEKARKPQLGTSPELMKALSILLNK